MSNEQPAVRVDIDEHHTTEDGPVFVATVTGRITVGETERFSELVAPLTQHPPAAVVVDCAGLDFVSSAGIGEIIKLEHATRALHAKFFLINVQQQVLSTLVQSKLDEMIPMYDSLEQALLHTDPS
ncbi:MAG: STAS domain-containing protein [Planctomycetota bacterium]